MFVNDCRQYKTHHKSYIPTVSTTSLRDRNSSIEYYNSPFVHLSVKVSIGTSLEINHDLKNVYSKVSLGLSIQSWNMSTSVSTTTKPITRSSPISNLMCESRQTEVSVREGRIVPLWSEQNVYDSTSTVKTNVSVGQDCTKSRPVRSWVIPSCSNTSWFSLVT